MIDLLLSARCGDAPSISGCAAIDSCMTIVGCSHKALTLIDRIM